MEADPVIEWNVPAAIPYFSLARSNPTETLQLLLPSIDKANAIALLDKVVLIGNYKCLEALAGIYFTP